MRKKKTRRQLTARVQRVSVALTPRPCAPPADVWAAAAPPVVVGKLGGGVGRRRLRPLGGQPFDLRQRLRRVSIGAPEAPPRALRPTAPGLSSRDLSWFLDGFGMLFRAEGLCRWFVAVFIGWRLRKR